MFDSSNSTRRKNCLITVSPPKLYLHQNTSLSTAIWWIHLAQGWWGTTPPWPACLQQHGAQSAAGPTGARRDPPNSQLPKSAATPQADASPTSTSHTDSRQPHHKHHPALKPQMSPASPPPTLAPHQRGPSPLLSPLGKSRRQGLPSSQRQRHSTRRSPLETAADHRWRLPQTIGDDRRTPSETTAGDNHRRPSETTAGHRWTPPETAGHRQIPLDHHPGYWGLQVALCHSEDEKASGGWLSSASSRLSSEWLSRMLKIQLCFHLSQ